MPYDGQIQGFPEFNRSRTDLLERARQIGWYHTIQLDAMLRTPGEFDLDSYISYYLPFNDLSSCACLEIGAGNGYWSFEIEKRRAKAINALDIPDFVDTDFSVRFGKESERPTTPSPAGTFGEGFRIASVLKQSKVNYVLGSVYDLRPEKHGTFDMVFCGSMLMHLFGPMIALQRMASVCRDTFMITTETDLSLEGLAALSYRGHEIPYVHFVPSPTCLYYMLTSCGYEKVLRGPTFYLEFRDKSNPMKIPHTSFIGLKSAAKNCVGLPPAGAVEGSAATAAIEIASAPNAVKPSQTFDLLARVRNDSSSFWHSSDPRNRIVLETRVAGQKVARIPVADYLAPGVDTLVGVKIQAPPNLGEMTIEFAVSQSGSPFKTNTLKARIPVTNRGGSDDSIVDRVKRTIGNLLGG